MADYLVIVESPAKAKTIEKFLGKKYIVKASVGHVRDLPKSKMGVDIENDFEPSYITIRGKGDLIKDLKKEASKVKKVLIATDPDREGEAIAWHLAHILGINEKDECRVTFREITKGAIREAVAHPRMIDKSLVDAQQARRILDRIVGYSISPILWRKVMKGLSAGRVQSVATRLIVERERAIEAFNPTEYWNITLRLKAAKGLFDAQVVKLNSKNLTISSGDEAKKVESDIKAETPIVKSIKTTEKRKSSPAPYTTSTMQQDASNRLGFSALKTMSVAQKLYEGIKIKGGATGLITYMRTDSVRISDEASKEVSEYIVSSFGKEYASASSKGKNQKAAQDAHEAIRPTSVHYLPSEIEPYLTKDQYKLYNMIWNRFVASQMSEAIFDSMTVIVEAGEYEAKAIGSVMKFDGFQKIYSYGTSKDKILPEMNEAEILKLSDIISEQKFTQPPSRYSEATLVKELEDKGIGRPSTYAPTISTIVKRGYVKKEKKVLFPTDLGFITNEIMESSFMNIIETEFTANMETELDDVEYGKIEWKDILREFYDRFKKDLDDAEESIKKYDLSEMTDIDCEKCGSKMLIKQSINGKFLACSNYPECKNTKSILNKVGIKCPACEKGDIIERKTKKLKTFYGCSSFPECNFALWDKPVDKKCPMCGSILTEGKGRNKGKLVCSNKECGYKE